MGNPPDLSRRDLLAGLSLSGMGMVAGCNSQRTGDSDTITVVFTDSTTGEGEVGTTATEPTDTTQSSDSEPIVFDGGDIEAFVRAVETANRAAEGTVIVEEGEYRFDPLEEAPTGSLLAHAEFQGIENVTIRGNGATFVFTAPLRYTLAFRGGKKLTITDLAIDYDPVPFTQGTITGSSTDPLSVGISLDDGYPELDHPMFERTDEFYALVHEPDGRFVSGIPKRGSWDPKIAGVTKHGPGEYELQIRPSFQSGGLEPDRKLTVLARNNSGGLSFQYVDNPTLENVSIHATNGGAVQFNVCEDPIITGCTIAPPPDSDRHIGANADGIRIINCRSSVTVEGCRHEYLGDDSLVIQNTVASVTSIIDQRTVAVENVHPFVVATGDVLDVFSPTGKRKGALPKIAEFESRFPLPGAHEKPKTITFEAPIEDRLAAGDFLRNRATGSQNFEVRNNEFRYHRANLIRIAASHGVIEDNILEGCPINPIELETDTFGYFSPKGWTSDVTIRNNKISRAGMDYFAGANPVGIHVHHRPAPDYTTEGYPNRNITIEGNEITESATGGIHIEAATDITIQGNELSDLNRMDLPAFADTSVSLDQVSNARIRGNAVSGSADSLDYFGIRRESDEIETGDNSVSIDGESMPADIVSLQPVRIVFDRTVRPSSVNSDSEDERPLAFRCREIALVDGNGEEIHRVDIGSEEEGISFGSGVWDPSRDGEWRWFGGETQTTVLYFADLDLRRAASLRLRGHPMEEGISMDAFLGDRRVDAVTFESNQTQWYSIALPGDG